VDVRTVVNRTGVLPRNPNGISRDAADGKTMRADVVAGGAATLTLMWIAYTVLSTSSLAPPAVLADVTLLVTVLGAGILVLGFVLKSPHAKTERRPDKARR